MHKTKASKSQEIKPSVIHELDRAYLDSLFRYLSDRSYPVLPEDGFDPIFSYWETPPFSVPQTWDDEENENWED